MFWFILLAVVWAAGVLEPYQLTDNNFEEAITSGKWVLVKFYAPWCGHCKAMKGEYEHLAWIFEDHSDIMIAELDATQHPKSKEAMEVKGFPTLILYPPSATKDEATSGALKYKGGDRSVEGLGQWVVERSGFMPKRKIPRGSVMRLDEKTFDDVVGGDVHVVVAFTASWCGHCQKLKPEFEKVGAAFLDDEAVIIANVDCAKFEHPCHTYGITGYPTIKFIPAHGGPGVALSYAGARAAPAMVNWVNQMRGGEEDLGEGRIPELDALIPSLLGGNEKALGIFHEHTLHFKELGKLYSLYGKKFYEGDLDVNHEIGKMKQVISAPDANRFDTMVAKASIGILGAFREAVAPPAGEKHSE